MIFLRAQNILFVKPHKTASTSVEIALSCGPGDDHDILTPLLPEDELKRAEAGGRPPQNWAWFRETERQYLSDFAQFRRTGTVPPPFPARRPWQALFQMAGALLQSHDAAGNPLAWRRGNAGFGLSGVDGAPPL